MRGEPLDFRCDYCLAEPGNPCRTLAPLMYLSFEAKKPHVARVRAAEEAEKKEGSNVA